jgi:hypothetical protein
MKMTIFGSGRGIFGMSWPPPLDRVGQSMDARGK